MKHQPESRAVGERIKCTAELFNFQNLYMAYLDCRRHKRKTHNAAKFELHFESELLKLEKELQSHAYRPDRSICFVVEEPSLREVFAGMFRDRVVHHLLYNFLEPVFEPKFIHGSYACRRGKGIHASLHDLQRYLRKITRNRHRRAYYLHLDIRGFFMALKKDILFVIIAKKIKNPEILWLAELVIFNNPVKNFVAKGNTSLFAKIPAHKSLFRVPKDQGLPIGNLTSQFFANVYLNELDQFVKHRLKARYYLRYVDDFLLLSCEKKQLEEWRDAIGRFLEDRLMLELHPQKQILQGTEKGIDWLGYIVKPDCVLVRRRIIRVFRQKLMLFDRMLAEYPNSAACRGQLPLPFPENDPPLALIETMLTTVNSYFGYFKHADTYKLRKHLWENHCERLRLYLEPRDANMLVLQPKRDFLRRAGRASNKQ